MPYGTYRMIPNHPRTSPSHHLTYPRLHLGFVAMNGTFSACRFIFCKLTVFKSYHCVTRQFFAGRTQLFIPLLPTAVQLNHLHNHPTLFLYPIHYLYMPKALCLSVQNYNFILKRPNESLEFRVYNLGIGRNCFPSHMEFYGYKTLARIVNCSVFRLFIVIF